MFLLILIPRSATFSAGLADLSGHSSALGVAAAFSLERLFLRNHDYIRFVAFRENRYFLRFLILEKSVWGDAFVYDFGIALSFDGNYWY